MNSTKNEPQSWAELLKMREAERNAPPPKEYYVRPTITFHPDGGVIYAQAPTTKPIEEKENEGINVDSHFYTSTRIVDPFDENEEDDDKETKRLKALRMRQNRHDHGLDITSWKIKSKYERERDDENEFRNRPRNYPKAQMESENYDIISGVPHQSPYKDTIQNILKQREYAKRMETKRDFDPISNTFPSESLENQRTTSELQTRKREVDYYTNKLFPNERRAKNTLVNIITGEVKNEEAAKAINEFPTSDTRRCVTALRLEKEIVERREKAQRSKSSQAACRFNNGRMKEIRNWNIISGESSKVGWNENVKMKPSIWTWCQAERLDV
ncbi:hypothetical protein M9Y10_035081 [Tritrichomonas musculus]|uniref:Uncharacterized protein n=1 Tax=Tritrichomonas musculus TaxID=1915356 RepID=A0ABR2KH71_9EUKA